MIEAELHSKVPSGLSDIEDILTSTVFGLLQYIPPTTFWPLVLKRAESCKGMSFAERCKVLAAYIPKYQKVDLYFWPVHQEFGEPDLLLVFSAETNCPP